MNEPTGRIPKPPPQPLTKEDLARMTSEELLKAYREIGFNTLLLGYEQLTALCEASDNDLWKDARELVRLQEKIAEN